MKRGVNFPFNLNRNMFFHGATFRITWSPTLNSRVSSSYQHTSSVYPVRLWCHPWWFSLSPWWLEPTPSHTTSGPQLLPNIEESCTSFHTRLHMRPSLIWLGDCCYTWTPPMLYVPPSFLQILAHMPVIGLPRLGWFFPISHQFEGEMQCSCPILSLWHIVCSTKVERWT